MSAILNELELDRNLVADAVATASVETRDEILRAAIALAVWRWFHANRSRRLKVKLWIFRPSVRVESLREWFELFFGPDPLPLRNPEGDGEAVVWGV